MDNCETRTILSKLSKHATEPLVSYQTNIYSQSSKYTGQKKNLNIDKSFLILSQLLVQYFDINLKILHGGSTSFDIFVLTICIALISLQHIRADTEIQRSKISGHKNISSTRANFSPNVPSSDMAISHKHWTCKCFVRVV